MPQSNGDSSDEARRVGFPIVAIGASAGGLEALRQLFARLPDDTGMAFVVIQHLDPGRPSMLSSVLAADVRMPVVEAADGMHAEPNRVYVIPPGADLGIHEGRLTLVPRQQTRKLHLPIDAFFRALAADLPGRAIGVVLSGSASDGTEGLRAIKSAGGITFVQEPESAQFPSMPESAIAAGVADFRLLPEAIAAELVRLGRHTYLGTVAQEHAADSDSESSITGAFAALRQHAQLDFRGYKRPTIMRRIARRMALRRAGSLEEYVAALAADPAESRALAEDILIHVTSFFRDPEVFAVLERRVLPELLAHKADNASFRVWVPGCSTGQEAYSLAICILEFLDEQGRDVPVKIFGSDISEPAIETARAGLFTDSDLEGVSQQRVSRFFERAEGRYRIGKRVRDLCVFVRHDLTRDPPFARLDLISCRNVLIYFDTALQRRIVLLLHHCLSKPGYLILGNSEGIREFDHLFAPLDKGSRIYLRTGESPRIDYPLALGREAESRLPVFQPTQRAQPARDAQRQADHVLLARYAPPGVVVDERLDVVQFRGRTGEFLEPPPGQPQSNVLKMAREGLVAPLREALEAAQAESVTVRREGVAVADGQAVRSVDIEVVPLAGAASAAEHYYLIVFQERPPSTSAGSEQPATVPHRATIAPNEEVERLKAELAAARDYAEVLAGEHQDTIEELGAANEELIAANEELQSTNEELQSTNEELQSAKEELQSANEELSTLNDELHDRNRQLDIVADDLVNVLESVQIPVVLVDHDLRVRRFTPTARQISSLLPGDVGRSIDDIKFKFEIDGLMDKIRATIDSLTTREYEIQRQDERWFTLHIRPYRTADNRLDGAILTFLDVDVLKRALQEAERARDYAQRIIETVPVALVVVDTDLRIESANPAFHRSFAARTEIGGHADLFESTARALDVPALRQAMDRSLLSHAPFQELDLHCELPTGTRDFVVAGCPLQSGDRALLLLAIEDVTANRLLEASEKHARVEAEQANRAKDLFLATLSHELRTPLSTILVSAQLLQHAATDDPRIQRASAAIERAVGNQVKLIDDLLDISRIVSGKMVLDLQAVDLATVVRSAVDVVQVSARPKGIELEQSIDELICPVHGDPGRLQQVFVNLLQNAVKFTPIGGKIAVTLEQVGGKARFQVVDTGLGIRAEMIPHLFDRFVQAEGAMTRVQGGLGLGLAIVQHIVHVHGGEVHAESPGEGQGATFTVTLPLATDDRAAKATGSRTVAQSISGLRVLLVEDDDGTRDMTATVLEAQGAEVRAVGSAAEGLAAIEDFDPQAILCDIAMPGEDGHAFVRALRRRSRGRRIPAAALTALVGEDDRRQALESGFQMHLRKPIDTERLITAVAALAAWPQPLETTSERSAPPGIPFSG